MWRLERVWEESNRTRGSAGERCNHFDHRCCGLVDETICSVRRSLFVPHHAGSGVPSALGDRRARRWLCGAERDFQFTRSVNRTVSFRDAGAGGLRTVRRRTGA